MPINQTGNALNSATIATNVGNLLRLMITTARTTPQAEGNLTTLVQRDPLPNGMGTSLNSPKFGTLAAYSLTQGIDMTQQQALTATNVSVTPAEVGVQIVLTRKSVAQWSEDVAMRAGVIMKQAMDRKKDVDIGGLFGTFTRTVGAAGQFLGLGHLSASVGRLAGGANTTGTLITAGQGINVAEGPYNGVFRPESLIYFLRTIIGGAAAPNPTVGTTSIAAEANQSLVRTGQSKSMGEWAGVDVFRNANLAKDSLDDVNGAVFMKGAIIYVPMEYDGLADMEQEVDKSLRAYELNWVEDYGFAILDDSLGVLVISDASALTG
jgi:hypothetical protein